VDHFDGGGSAAVDELAQLRLKGDLLPDREFMSWHGSPAAPVSDEIPVFGSVVVMLGSLDEFCQVLALVLGEFC
jgi:hypothetical protein